MRSCFYRVLHWWCNLSGLHRITISLQILGFLLVAVYTTIAAWQACLLRQTVAQQVLINRPVVIQNRTFITKKAGKWVAWVTFINFGKSVAKTVVAPGHIYVLGPENFIVDPDCRLSSSSPPTNLENTALAPTEGGDYRRWGQYWDVAPDEDGAGIGSNSATTYVSGCVYYKGLDGKPYKSYVCITWSLTRTDEAYQACPPPGRNDAE